MKAKKAERELSAWMDGEAGARRRAAAGEDPGASPALRRTRAQFEAIGETLRDDPVPAGQTPEAAWSDIQRRLRPAVDAPGEAGSSGIFASRMRWVAAMVVAVFIGLAGLWIGNSARNAEQALAATGGVDVEWVETGVENADTMVYWDEETDLTVIWLLIDEAPEGDNADT